MSSRIDEELLKQMVVEVDRFVSKLVTDNQEKMHPLEVSAVFISRLMLMHRTLGTEDQFKRLTTASLNIQEPNWRKDDAEQRPN